MAFFDSNISRFHIADTTGASRDLSASITDIQGIPGSRSLIEITSLTDDGPTYVGGARDSAVTLTGIFDDATDVVLGGTAQPSLAGRVQLRPGRRVGRQREVLRPVLDRAVRSDVHRRRPRRVHRNSQSGGEHFEGRPLSIACSRSATFPSFSPYRHSRESGNPEGCGGAR